MTTTTTTTTITNSKVSTKKLFKQYIPAYFCQPDGFQTIKSTALGWGLLLVGWVLWMVLQPNFFGLLFIFLSVATGQRYLANLFHEASHFHLFASKLHNDLFTNLFITPWV